MTSSRTNASLVWLLTSGSANLEGILSPSTEGLTDMNSNQIGDSQVKSSATATHKESLSLLPRRSDRKERLKGRQGRRLHNFVLSSHLPCSSFSLDLTDIANARLKDILRQDNAVHTEKTRTGTQRVAAQNNRLNRSLLRVTNYNFCKLTADSVKREFLQCLCNECNKRIK